MGRPTRAPLDLKLFERTRATSAAPVTVRLPTPGTAASLAAVVPWLGLVYCDSSVLKRLAVHVLNGCFGFLLVRHLDKRKAL